MTIDPLLVICIIAALMVAYIVRGEILWNSGDREGAVEIWGKYLAAIFLVSIIIIVIVLIPITVTFFSIRW